MSQTLGFYSMRTGTVPLNCCGAAALYTSPMDEVQVVFLSCSSGIYRASRKNFFWAIVFSGVLQATFIGVGLKQLGVNGAMSWALNRRGNEMDSNPIVIALSREKNLLEQVLSLAICQLDLVEAGRLEDLEFSLLVRAERMRELAVAEVNINAKMPDIENDPTLSSTELQELHYLNLQITRLTDSIVDIDERAQHLVELCSSGAPPESLTGA